jgi:predicted phosphate transport protein (TIGR00153 family)
MGEHSCDAAKYLREILGNFNPDDLDIQMEKMHSIEHDGDVARHAMTKRLSKEFMTPIDREDIMGLAGAIDTVTDKIEDVLMRLYMFNIQSIRSDVLYLGDMIVRITDVTLKALQEFGNFKKSKTINDILIEINHMEEEGDRLYTAAVRGVFTDQSLPPLDAAAWNQVLHYMEDVCDACEDVADVIEGVIMKNS